MRLNAPSMAFLQDTAVIKSFSSVGYGLALQGQGECSPNANEVCTLPEHQPTVSVEGRNFRFEHNTTYHPHFHVCDTHQNCKLIFGPRVVFDHTGARPQPPVQARYSPSALFPSPSSSCASHHRPSPQSGPYLAAVPTPMPTPMLKPIPTPMPAPRPAHHRTTDDQSG